MNQPLLRISNVCRYFEIPVGFGKSKTLKAVDDLSIEIQKGTTFCIVGESGSGKSTTANMILGLDKPTKGKIYWQGKDISKMSKLEKKSYRRKTNAVFQDPMGSLDPRIRIGDIIAEPLRQLPKMSAENRKALIAENLQAVGLDDSIVARFPHEFSGGQRQRITIARALIASPDLIVLDEPVASLDLSTQAQVLNLLKRLQKERGMSYLMISHNLATVRFLADKVAVMFGGKIVELGTAKEVISNPSHSYTRKLIEAARMTEIGSISQI